MPTTEEHLAIAKRNEATLAYLLEKVREHSEWVATVAFYTALHYVEAVFFHDLNGTHGHNHESRDRLLKCTKRYENIYRHYRPLWEASVVARYMQRDGETRLFSKYLSPDKVEEQLVRHRLHQLRKSAERLLGIADTSSASSTT